LQKDRKRTNFGGNIGKKYIWHIVLKQLFEKNIRVEQKITNKKLDPHVSCL
jgi:hypothetical protein